MLHSINALRVVAEFFVVKYHLFPRLSEDSSVPMVLEALAAVDLMSFFFVLSGFVCTYAHKGDDWTVKGCWVTFYRRKAAKMYPIYLLGLAVNIATRSATYDPWFWGCLMADVAVVSPWTYCMNSCDARQAAWYLSVLFWLWLAFPPLQQLTCLQRHPWITVICLYCISLIPWFYLVVHPWEYVAYSQLPICRLAEFLIGCTLTSTLHTRVSTWLCALVRFILHNRATRFPISHVYVHGDGDTDPSGAHSLDVRVALGWQCSMPPYMACVQEPHGPCLGHCDPMGGLH